jgi:uncharacterized membrane protein
VNKKYIIFELSIILLLSLGLLSTTVSAAPPAYNARMNLNITWNDAEIEKPIIPRDEIKIIELNIDIEIETGPSFGEGLFKGYYYPGSYNVIHLEVMETPSWCSAVLERTMVITQMMRKTNTTAVLYLTLDEDAPAFGGEGIIKIKASSEDSGLIKGTNETFELPFIPDYIPIIKTNLPELNTKKITPSESATFPIEIENAGNARTKVFFEIENVPDDWSATVTDVLILNEEKGSKATAYLTIVPSTDLGYHYEESKIQVKMTPTMAENIEKEGTPIYANFVIQNRGFSSSGIEAILPIIFIIFLIIFIVIYLLRKRKVLK